MAFWDDIKNKVSDTANSAVNKANEIAEVSKLNGLIAEEDKKIKNLYYQIGKLYVAQCGNNPDPAFAELVAAVIESGRAMKEYKDQINVLKGIRICDKCGADVPKGAAFCNACGNQMPVVPEFDTDKFDKCPVCGALVEKGMRFCTTCGQAMGTAAPVAPAAPAAPAERICKACGATVEADAAFCCECGARYEG